MQNFLISGLKFWDDFKAVYLVKSLNNCLVHSFLHLIPNPQYRKVASPNTSRLEAHAGFFILLMKGIFDPYVL